jgi:hypothetical protein
MVNHRNLTPAMIDSRDFIRSRRQDIGQGTNRHGILPNKPVC